MTRYRHTICLAFAAGLVVLFVFGLFRIEPLQRSAEVQAAPSPIASPVSTPAFDQAAALAKLREQIKGREQEPGEKVFKNLQMNSMKAAPAARVLAVMELGYARSLGVNCTHCHLPEKWESDEKPQKDIAREMAGMVFRINSDILKNIKNLKSATPTVNCTTCHRGQLKPALNLPVQ